ncbi:MAG: hypothetical protein UR60_C0004G0011 [Candidatus Moranbacteria bacterium GW2011_GWF2_34_56]|nr:MAG: hypothetical protein UR51_C0010G0062 [Candidatus Moranbacteria bacterium GW2011_GWF1_34_10]KKP65282.1 MAG: hypothetical protein UR60_C0004G0011 [Candidatus Moranbacteria bacterium GW2011_GWF2_34_56]HBI17539.1 hypothetical protein [Candidatus Moranbacteria bacterium]
MLKRFLKLCLVGILGFFVFTNHAFARENVTDWYIKRFDSQIVVNRDSTLTITEKIVADCGNAVGKHGIFRILPYKINIEGKGAVKTPIDLISIKDENGNDYEYMQSKNSTDSTMTWKIGDLEKTVTGENTYVIKYKVENAIRFYDDNFDEFYWNLTGNFWNLEIDSARIEVIFPEEVNRENADIYLYSGYLGEKDNKLATYGWMNNNMLEFHDIQPLLIGQGITTSVTFPKNIFTPYKPNFLETYGKYLFFILPVLVFLICFRVWKKYGNDLPFSKTTIAQYEAPQNMSMIEMGLLMSNGNFKNNFVTAEIINLATKKIITIKEVENKILFFNSKDYEISRLGNKDEENKLSAPQKVILDKLFEAGESVRLSSLKSDFYKILNDLRSKGNDILANEGLIERKGIKYSLIFIPIGFILLFFGVFFVMVVSGWLGVSVAATGLIVAIFGFVMPKRTLKGAELNWQIKGLKLFMETVDKDRAKFYEEENIFEKFLPYAILFGITGIWIKRIKEIYGEEYFVSHAPAWYMGSTLGSFNADSFNSALDDLSNNIAASTSAPSGSGGSGGSGGGGGGGGGGGW